SQYQIQLKWQDNSAETAFIIERKAPDEGTFKEIAVVPQNSNGYIDNVPKENALYEYRVKAVTGTTMSEYSDTATVASTYLRMPSALSAAAVDGKTVNLTWQDMTSGETGFEIWRKAASDTDWTLYDTMGRNATSYVDTNVMPQTTYSYKVRAKINDNSIYSDFSNEANILMSTISGPSNLTCNVVTNTQVDLTWDDNSNVEAGFIVEKKVGILSQWNQIASLNPNTTKYTDKWISGSDIVSYRIRAFDRSNIIGYSNEVTVSTKTPTPPTNLKVTAVSTNDMKLTWSDNSTSEEGFIIEAKQLYVFKEIGRVGSGVTTFEYMDASPGKAATYRVRAVNGSMQSNPSNEVTATPLTGAAYTDLASVSWAVEAINNLSSRNVFDAKTDSKFYPAQNITKGEYCSILVRSLGLQEVAAGRFADVTSKHKYYMEIVSAQRKGIITPDKNNRLYPDSLVTREQAGVMLALALKIKGTPLPERDTSSLKQFADYRSVSEASANSIAAVCGAGIFSGRKINDKVYLQLANKVTRAEAALMVYKGLYYKK
ncbi:MAG TPA: S-layer homology domain-containing protein, partial [Ruminiclostridium sp.]|nr:S-layer homology domain-containing protein [Ruminiclostridium sp.]